jgi:metallo-beta-lactamase family protein
LGNPPAPIVGDTEFCGGADIVVMESTYGGRIHEPATMRLAMLQKAIMECIRRRGVLMIPAFSLERTQEVLYELNSLVENNHIPHLPIFVDSPLAIRAVEVYRRYEKMFDKESQQLIKSGDDLFKFPGLKYTKTVEESKTINSQRPPFVVMAGSGMCTGGRIVHHLKHHLGDPNSHVLIISYQPEGSVGRQLIAHAKTVIITDESVRVRASASAIGSYSSHADQPKLLHWVKSMVSPKPKQVYIVHGELKSNEMLADGLLQKLEVASVVPEYGKTYEV